MVSVVSMAPFGVAMAHSTTRAAERASHGASRARIARSGDQDIGRTLNDMRLTHDRHGLLTRNRTPHGESVDLSCGQLVVNLGDIDIDFSQLLCEGCRTLCVLCSHRCRLERWIRIDNGVQRRIMLTHGGGEECMMGVGAGWGGVFLHSLAQLYSQTHLSLRLSTCIFDRSLEAISVRETTSGAYMSPGSPPVSPSSYTARRRDRRLEIEHARPRGSAQAIYRALSTLCRTWRMSANARRRRRSRAEVKWGGG